MFILICTFVFQSDSMTLMSQSRQRTCRRKYPNYGRRNLGRLELSSGNESSSSIRHVSFITLKHTKLSWILYFESTLKLYKNTVFYFLFLSSSLLFLVGLIPGSGRSPGVQYSCLATVHGAAKSLTWFSD